MTPCSLSSNCPAVREAWAAREFGTADYGDARLNRRFLSMAAQVAAHPGSLLTEVFADDAAARQAAYKHLEHGRFPHAETVASAQRAAWRRARHLSSVLVALDGSTLSLSRASFEKGFGRVGDRKSKSFGAESLNGVLLDPSGTPLGLAAQFLWTRRKRRPKGQRTSSLPLSQKETRYWVLAGDSIEQRAREAGFEGEIWLQVDAGAEAKEVLAWAAWTERLRVTVRCRQDRKVLWPAEQHLWDWLPQQPELGRMQVKVGRSRYRGAREANLVLRASEVVLPLRDPSTELVQQVVLFAVHAREEGTCPAGEEPIEWLLLTTKRVRGAKGAREVVRAYAKRWRVEEVYRTWKKGGCQVEASGLAYPAFQSWAALLLCNAVRIERLKRLAREQPELPASSEFSNEELRALLLLRKKTEAGWSGLTLGVAVRYLAELGGYTGKSSGGPPGSTTLTRGLFRLEPAAELLHALGSGKK